MDIKCTFDDCGGIYVFWRLHIHDGYHNTKISEFWSAHQTYQHDSKDLEEIKRSKDLQLI